ncbi:MAG: YHS domain-containing protein [Candidatus Eremiobacteraeota bacterium]|nr:YHS domain-containing protein [Candidatus Eremiobacteraeota bacterium]
MIFCIFLALHHSEKNTGNKKTGKQTSSPSHSDGRSGESGKDLDSGITVTDPVCGKAVDPADAPYHYSYAGKMFYFCGEKCLKVFIDEPLYYSGAKVKVRITVKGTPPSESPIESPIEEPFEYPEDLQPGESDIIPDSKSSAPPIEVIPDATGSPTTPTENGEEEKESPAGDSNGGDKSISPEETPVEEKTPDSESKPLEKTPAPKKEPELKSTPIEPPSGGIETL